MTSKRVKTIYKTPAGDVVYGVMAEFDSPVELTHAAEQVRDAGYTCWDVYSPFPVHGMEDAMGVKATRLPLLVGACGLGGALVGLGFQFWVTHLAYPMVVQGKPPWAWEPLTPVTFEIGVLGTAFSALLGMFAFNKLPMWYHPLMKKQRFLRVSDDRFVICIETSDPKFDPSGTRTFLSKIGGKQVELVED